MNKLTWTNKKGITSRVFTDEGLLARTRDLLVAQGKNPVLSGLLPSFDRSAWLSKTVAEVEAAIRAKGAKPVRKGRKEVLVDQLAAL